MLELAICMWMKAMSMMAHNHSSCCTSGCNQRMQAEAIQSAVSLAYDSCLGTPGVLSSQPDRSAAGAGVQMPNGKVLLQGLPVQALVAAQAHL